MANEDKKDFNAMLNDSKDMPKIQIVADPGTIKKYGGDRMYFAPPIDYDRAMRLVPKGKLTIITDIRSYFARETARTSPSLSRRGYSCPSPPGPAVSGAKTRPPTGAR